jgi:hypothetical protein
MFKMFVTLLRPPPIRLLTEQGLLHLVAPKCSVGLRGQQRSLTKLGVGANGQRKRSDQPGIKVEVSLALGSIDGLEESGALGEGELVEMPLGWDSHWVQSMEFPEG